MKFGYSFHNIKIKKKFFAFTIHTVHIQHTHTHVHVHVLIYYVEIQQSNFITFYFTFILLRG